MIFVLGIKFKIIKLTKKIDHIFNSGDYNDDIVSQMFDVSLPMIEYIT